MSTSTVSWTNSWGPPFAGLRGPRKPLLPGSGSSSIIRRRWGNSCWDGGRKVLCACTAPLRNWGDGPSALDTYSSFIPENLGAGKDVKGEPDVLIECRDVHKSFGDKKILRGVSFKISRLYSHTGEDH